MESLTYFSKFLGCEIPEILVLIATFDTNTNTETNLCLSDAIFSDTNANGIPVNLGSCIDVDFNNSLYGDLDGDGVVNVIDAVILVNAVLNGENISGGDLNSDGIVNILDIVILVEYILNAEAVEIEDADINDDGDVNILDIVQLVNIILS